MTVQNGIPRKVCIRPYFVCLRIVFNVVGQFREVGYAAGGDIAIAHEAHFAEMGEVEEDGVEGCVRYLWVVR